MSREDQDANVARQAREQIAYCQERDRQRVAFLAANPLRARKTQDNAMDLPLFAADAAPTLF